VSLIVLLMDDGYQLVAQKKFRALLNSQKKMEYMREKYSSRACQRKKCWDENA